MGLLTVSRTGLVSATWTADPLGLLRWMLRTGSAGLFSSSGHLFIILKSTLRRLSARLSALFNTEGLLDDPVAAQVLQALQEELGPCEGLDKLPVTELVTYRLDPSRTSFLRVGGAEVWPAVVNRTWVPCTAVEIHRRTPSWLLFSYFLCSILIL